MKAFSLLLVLIICFSSCSDNRKQPPQVIDGNMDLTGWDFVRDGDVNLDGKWEFYWNKLLLYADFQSDSSTKPDIFISVPKPWIDAEINGVRLPSEGYATYRLLIRFPANYKQKMAMYMPDCFSAYRLYLNGVLSAQNGIVSSRLEESKPQLVPQIIFFDQETDSLVLIIQVANNFAYEGGLWQKITLGKQRQILKTYQFDLMKRLFLVGAIFILFLYHLWIYFFHKSEKAFLWFAILCILITLRALITRERLLYIIFPEFPVWIGRKLEYLDLAMVGYTMIAFFFYLGLIKISKKSFKLISLVYIPVYASILFLPHKVYSSYLIVYIVVVGVSCLFSLAHLIFGWRKERFYTRTLLFVLLISVISYTNDSLVSLNILHTQINGPEPCSVILKVILF